MVMEDSPLMKWLWPLLASLAGSVTAQSFRSFKNMTPWEIIVAIFVGASFSIFVTPLIIHMTYGPAPGINLYVLGGLFYVSGTSYNVLLPWIIRRLTGLMGDGATGGSSEKEVNP